MFIYGYNMKSKTVSQLRKCLGIKGIRHEKSRFKGNANKKVINWGSSKLPAEVMKCQVFNDPENVGECTNKLKFFKMMEKTDVNIPVFTTNIDDVKVWLENKMVVFARQKLQAHSGEGIVEINSEDEIVPAPLYTQYIPKADEYRVHIVQGEVIDIQRKAARNNMPKEDVNWRVRNHIGGFIFARNEGKKPPACVEEEALKCFEYLGLDFCSIDIIYNKYRKKAYVLEANTATGLTGTTLDNYVKAFNKMLGVE